MRENKGSGCFLLGSKFYAFGVVLSFNDGYVKTFLGVLAVTVVFWLFMSLGVALRISIPGELGHLGRATAESSVWVRCPRLGE